MKKGKGEGRIEKRWKRERKENERREGKGEMERENKPKLEINKSSGKKGDEKGKVIE